jgi:phosphoribosyl-ATP pyrophosphohydrolase/phosphoribosyl-AMP cyclohydrolase
LSFVPDLEAFLRARLEERPEGSYSVTVMDDRVLAQRKVMEEAFEVCLELAGAPVDAERLAEESADLVFHLLCGLIGAGVPWSAVEAALRARHG